MLVIPDGNIEAEHVRILPKDGQDRCLYAQYKPYKSVVSILKKWDGVFQKTPFFMRNYGEAEE